MGDSKRREVEGDGENESGGGILVAILQRVANQYTYIRPGVLRMKVEINRLETGAIHMIVLFISPDVDGSGNPNQFYMPTILHTGTRTRMAKQVEWEIERAIREYEDHEFKEGFRRNEQPVYPPHNPDGSVT